MPKDYCATPQGSSVVIIGYKIWAFQREATNLVNNVTQTSLRSHAKGSIIKHCYGDEKGTIGGVCSGTHNGECTPKTWSETVTFGGRNAVRDSDEWWMNNKNTWGVLDYKTGAPQPANKSTAESVKAKLWLAQAVEAEPDVEPYEPMTPSEPSYRPPPYDPPGSPANDDDVPNPQPAPENPRQDPQAGPNTSVGPDATPTAKPAFKSEVVTTKRQRVDCTCLVGSYASIEYRCRVICKGQTHHLIPDMVFRFSARPTSKGGMTSDTNRIMGAPTFNDGMSVCISENAHKAVHNYLRTELNNLGNTSGVPGTALLGKISGVAQDSINKLRRNHECNETIRATLEEQDRLIPYNNVGRTQENLPLSDEATKALQNGTY